jgi:hypothetical protein
LRNVPYSFFFFAGHPAVSQKAYRRSCDRATRQSFVSFFLQAIAEMVPILLVVTVCFQCSPTEANKLKLNPVAVHDFNITFPNYTVCFKKRFTTLKTYIHLFRGNVQYFELS